MGFVFDADALIAALEARGYEAEREAETLVMGRLHRAAVRQVWVDGGGRVRFQATRMGDEPAPEIVVQNERAYRVSRETHYITNVYVSLDDAAGLGEVLDDIDRLERGAPPALTAAPTPYEAATAEADRPSDAPATTPTPPEAPTAEDEPTDQTAADPEAPDHPPASSAPPEANDDSPLTQLKRFWRRLI